MGGVFALSMSSLILGYGFASVAQLYLLLSGPQCPEVLQRLLSADAGCGSVLPCCRSVVSISTCCSAAFHFAHSSISILAEPSCCN